MAVAREPIWLKLDAKFGVALSTHLPLPVRLVCSERPNTVSSTYQRRYTRTELTSGLISEPQSRVTDPVLQKPQEPTKVRLVEDGLRLRRAVVHAHWP